jgi:hypothetical protein
MSQNSEGDGVATTWLDRQHHDTSKGRVGTADQTTLGRTGLGTARKKNPQRARVFRPRALEGK